MSTDTEDFDQQDEKHADAVLEMIKKHVHQIMEHVDSVQIFVSYTSPDASTHGIKTGDGNYFARYGQVREWITHEEQRQRLEVEG